MSSSAPSKPRLKESALQAQIVAVLSGLGYTCLQAGLYRKRSHCPKCQHAFFSHAANGSSAGIADILVTRDGWPGVFAGIEIKGQGTRVREAQRALADAGRNQIVYSIAQAVDAVQSVETHLGLVNARLARFWELNPRHRLEESKIQSAG